MLVKRVVGQVSKLQGDMPAVTRMCAELHIQNAMCAKSRRSGQCELRKQQHVDASAKELPLMNHRQDLDF